jgi:hypothetical protein
VTGIIPGYFFPDAALVFFVDLVDFAGFPLTAFFCFPLACCLAGVVECFGLATLAPLVTGASSCSAAFGVASDATLKKQNAAAKSKCGIFFVRNFMTSCPVPLSIKCLLLLSRLAKVHWQVCCEEFHSTHCTFQASLLVEIHLLSFSVMAWLN